VLGEPGVLEELPSCDGFPPTLPGRSTAT